MKNKKILVTGSSGLIGSEVVTYFANQGATIHGVDNNMREVFLGRKEARAGIRIDLQADLKSLIIMKSIFVTVAAY